jgi:hypothetical protein
MFQISPNRSCGGAVGAALLSLVLACHNSETAAADLPLKAPPPSDAAAESDIHGFFDTTFKNDYMSPRGLLLSDTGITTQILAGLTFDLYKNRTGFVNSVSVTGAVWGDLWSDQHNPAVGPWKEFDWYTSVTVGFAQNWKFGVTFYQFVSPINAFNTDSSIEYLLSYDDSKSGLPIALHPYAKLFWLLSGTSVTAVGKNGDTFDIELGIVPTLDLKGYGLPVIVTAPTWFTVGPASFWNRDATGTGPSVLSSVDTGNFGVISTGLTAKIPLTFVPARLGNWYVDGGFQYYHLINDSLLLAQTVTGAAPSLAAAHRDVVVGFAGVGFTF